MRREPIQFNGKELDYIPDIFCRWMIHHLQPPVSLHLSISAGESILAPFRKSRLINLFVQILGLYQCVLSGADLMYH